MRRRSLECFNQMIHFCSFLKSTSRITHSEGIFFFFYDVGNKHLKTGISRSEPNNVLKITVFFGNAPYIHRWIREQHLHEVSGQNDGTSCFVFQQQIPGASSGVGVHSRGGLIQENSFRSSNKGNSATVNNNIKQSTICEWGTRGYIAQKIRKS